MLNKIKSAISRNLNNFRGWTTSRKIIVIESDDWGTIRMPTKEVYDYFVKKGYPLEDRVYEKYDTLASDEDLEVLFSTLKKVNNKNGQNPIITANTIVANPDFVKIKEHNFKEYFFEPFTVTLKKYFPDKDVFSVWEKGIEQKLFHPQLHCREHFNIIKWMNLLQEKDNDALEAFEKGMVGIPSIKNPQLGNQLMVALSVDNESDIEKQKKALVEGLDLFENIFGYRSKSFIAPVYTWNKALERILHENGVFYLQGGRNQNNPEMKGVVTKISHYLGEKNDLGQHYLIRNVFFEPATNKNKDWVNDCFKDVELAFLWKKPAVISTHRLNYTGSLDSENRVRGNRQLLEFLTKVVEKYPDIEFMTSDQLGDLISKNKL